MKRLVVLLVMLVLVAGLGACGESTSTAETTEAASATTTAEVTTTADTATPDQSATTASSVAAVTFEKMDLKVSTMLKETDVLAACFKALMDHVTQATNGAVTFTVYWSSTLCAPAEDLFFIQSGDVDLVQLNLLAYGDALPLYQFPQTFVGTPEESQEYFYDILFNNSETAAIEDAQMAEYNAKTLGMAYTGPQGYFARFEWSTLADLKGHKIGCVDPTVLTYLGMNTVVLPPPDGYENLERGVIDGATQAFGGYMDMLLYEVAPYFGMDGQVSWGSPYVLRNDLWQAFPEELRTIFLEGAEAAAEMSIQIGTESEASQIDLVKSTGGDVFDLNTEDQLASKEANVIATVETGLARAEQQGCLEDMTTVLKHAVELQGMEWKW